MFISLAVKSKGSTYNAKTNVNQEDNSILQAI